MENAKWKGVTYVASDIVDAYDLEKQIRIASGKRELLCPNPDCKNPVLKYCRGEKRTTPYFSHLNNCACDYAAFDKENTPLLRQVKHKIYEILKHRGFDVKIEIKILSNHYTHFLVSLSNEKKIAIELGTPKSTAIRVDNHVSQYKEAGIDVKWIVINNDHTPVKERSAAFLKRYLLNESNCRDVLVLDWNGSRLTQYIIDSNRYEYKGRIIHSDNYPEIYCENNDISQLTIENEELTIEGFYERYNEWLTKKSKAFEKKKAILEDEDRNREQEQRIIEQNKTEQRKIEQRPEENLVAFVNEFWRPFVSSIRCKICGEMKSKNSFYNIEYDVGLCNDCMREKSKKRKL